MNYPNKRRAIIFVVIALAFSCTKLDLVRVNKVSTGSATNVTHQSATISGSTIEVGDKGIDQHGFYLSTNSDPTTGDFEKSELGSMGSSGAFSEGFSDLDPGTTYYFLAYLENKDREVRGEVASFQTLAMSVPSVETVDITSISQTSAVSGGNVTDNGGSTVTTRGVCWSTEQNPTILNSKSTDGNGTGAFISSISGLTCGTTYYIRAYATNATGTAYGTQLSFITSDCTADPPTVTTSTVAGILETIAQGGGNVTNTGGAEVTAKGVCWSTSPNPTLSDSKTVDGIGTGGFTSTISGLTCGTTYYVRAYATNESGTAYGEQVDFTTTECPTGLPVVTTVVISGIQETTAQGGGDVTDDGGASVTEKGVVWSTSQNPTTTDNKTTDGSGTGGFTSVLSGLQCGTTYYVRAYATNENGTAYGEQVYFTTSSCAAVVPTVSTDTVTEVGETSVVLGGNVTDDGGATVSAKGVVWSTTQNPTLSDNYTTDGSGTGSFSSSISGLTCGTTYYVRAYATNEAGTGYGIQRTVSTSNCNSLATVTTTAISSITETTAQGGGSVSNDGGTTVSAKGIVWSTSQNPTTADSKTTDGTGTGGYTSALTGLQCATTYYVRAYATNGSGTAYGQQVSFTTSSCPVTVPSVTTGGVSAKTESSITLGGNVTDDGGAAVIAKGVVWSTSMSPTLSDNYTTDGSGIGVFSSTMTGLSCSTTYYVRAYATNSAGTAYGNELTVATDDCSTPPTVSTNEITDVGITTATGGGYVSNQGSSTVTARGIVWGTSMNPTLSDNYTTNGSGTGSFTSYLTGLPAYTSIYVRAYATNSAGTAYGDNVNFLSGYVADYETNLYKFVEIGSQTWLAENLRSTKYEDGRSIPLVTSASNWSNLSYGDKAYCWFNNDDSNPTWGILYTWGAATDGATGGSDTNPSGIQGVCPHGWHIPSDAEWKQLEVYLGMSQSEADLVGDKRGTNQGGKLKITGYTYWNSPNTDATNETGFTGVGNGYRDLLGDYVYRGKTGMYWSTRESGGVDAYSRYFHHDDGGISRWRDDKRYGFSVRCVKD